MPSCAELKLLAAYNAGMNRKLYAAAARLSEEQLHADRKAFFGSLFGTMNHLVAADTIWLTRFAQHPAGFAALAAFRDGPVPSDLRQPYGSGLATLQAHRLRLDGTIEALAAELLPAHVEQVLVYRNTRGTEYRKRFGDLLLHLFNHQTHHRGQASTLLTQAGVDIGVTDLLELVPDAG